VVVCLARRVAIDEPNGFNFGIGGGLEMQRRSGLNHCRCSFGQSAFP
jgi:hypothetical protein